MTPTDGAGKAFARKVASDPKQQADFKQHLAAIANRLKESLRLSNAEFAALAKRWEERGMCLDDWDSWVPLCRLAGVDPDTITNRFQIFEIASRYFEQELMRVRVEEAARREAGVSLTGAGHKAWTHPRTAIKEKATALFVRLRETMKDQEAVNQVNRQLGEEFKLSTLRRYATEIKSENR